MASAIVVGAIALLMQAAPKECADCHGPSMTAASARKVVHAPFKDQAKCDACHAPHGPNGKDAAMRSPEPQLCTRCHTDERYGQTHRTSLAERGLCTPCHAGHASDRPALLKVREGELCARCHKGASVSHGGYGVNEARCTICHPSHGKTSGKRLGAVVHPVANDCSSCHRAAGSKEQFQRRKEAPELCFECHPDVQTALARRVVHPAVSDAGCLSCHVPHAGRQPKLLIDREAKVCLECHPTLEEKLKAKVVHAPVRRGECHTCHSPHASANEKLLVRPGGKLCEGCHAQVVGWPGAPSVHAPVRAGTCVACHDAHGGGPKLLPNGGSKPCASCHPSLHKRLKTPGAVVHAPVADDCLGCHGPHVSEQPSLLKASPPGLCAECHDLSDADLVKKHGGYSIAEAVCTGCHDPHVGDAKGLLRAERHVPFADAMCDSCHVEAKGAATEPKLKDGGLALCGDCHEFAAMQTKPRAHDPVKKGACFACHSPHAASRTHLVKANVASLCGECHDPSDGGVAARHRKIKADDQCTRCHQPHEPRFAGVRGSATSSKPSKGSPAGARRKGEKGSRAR